MRTPLLLLAFMFPVAACTGGNAPRPLEVTAIEVTQESELGSLELEVHAYDGVTGAWLGCAGGNTGLGGDLYSDALYPVSAELVDADSRPLLLSALGGHPLKIQVWEDDDNLPCPHPGGPAGPDSLADDLVGTSPVLDLATWQAQPTHAFDHVVQLDLYVPLR
jgi:hypothetical protein